MYLCNSVAPRLNIASTLLSHGYIQGDLTRSTKTKLALIMAELQQNRERSNSSLKGWSFQTTTRIISTRNALATTVVNGVTQQQVFSTLTPQIVTTKEQWGAKLGSSFELLLLFLSVLKKVKENWKSFAFCSYPQNRSKAFANEQTFFISLYAYRDPSNSSTIHVVLRKAYY